MNGNLRARVPTLTWRVFYLFFTKCNEMTKQEKFVSTENELRIIAVSITMTIVHKFVKKYIHFIIRTGCLQGESMPSRSYDLSEKIQYILVRYVF